MSDEFLSRRKYISAAVTASAFGLAGCSSSGEEADNEGQSDDTTDDEGQSDDTTDTSGESGDDSTSDEDEQEDEQAEDQEEGSDPPEQVEVSEGDSIQDAISRVAEDGIVQVASGTYTQSVTVDKPVTLEGDGAVLEADGADGNNGVVIAAPSTEISGFEIANYSGAGVLTADDTELSSVTLRDLIIEEVGQYGISLIGADNGSATVTNVEVTSAGSSGIGFLGSFADITAEEVTTSRNAGQGIEVSRVREQSLTLSTVTALENDGIGIDAPDLSDGTSIDVTEVDLLDNDAQAARLFAADITVSDLTAERHVGSSGVYLRSTEEGTISVTGITVIDVEAPTINDPGYGIYVEDGAEATVENFDIRQTESTGLGFFPDSARGVDYTARNGLIEDSSYYGIDFGSSSGTDTVTVEDTEVYNVDRRTVSVSGVENITITGVTAENANNPDSNVYAKSTREGTVTIRDSTVRQTEGAGRRAGGVTVIDGTTVTLENVESTSHRSDNFRVDTDTARGQTVTITGCYAENSSVGDSYYYGGSSGQDEITVTDCTAIAWYDFDRWGYVLGGEEVTVRNCTAEGSGNGPINILEASEANTTLEGNEF